MQTRLDSLVVVGLCRRGIERVEKRRPLCVDVLDTGERGREERGFERGEA